VCVSKVPSKDLKLRKIPHRISVRQIITIASQILRLLDSLLDDILRIRQLVPIIARGFGRLQSIYEVILKILTDILVFEVGELTVGAPIANLECDDVKVDGWHSGYKWA